MCVKDCQPYLAMVSSFLIMYFTLGTAFGSAPVYYNYWLEEFQQHKGITSLVGGLNVGMILTLGLIPSILANRFSHRVIICAGALISTVCLIGSSFAQSIPALLTTHTICGFGWSLAGVPGTMAPSFYWKEKYHGIMFGIILSGIGLGQFVTPLLVEALCEAYSWRGALLLQAGLNLNLFACGAILIPVQGMRKESNFLEPELLKDPYFINSLVYWIFCHMGISVANVHLAYVVKKALGADNQIAATMVAILGVAGTVTRISHGLISRLPRVNPMLQQMISVCLMASMILIIPSIRSFWLMCVVVVILSVGLGSMAINSLLVIDIVGLKSRTAGFGFFSTCAGLGIASGAPVAGLLSDLTGGNYAVSLYFGGGVQLLAVVLQSWVLCRWNHVRLRHMDVIEVAVDDVDQIEEEEEL